MTRSVYPAHLVYVDGSSRGNPGPSGIGIVIYAHPDDTKPLIEISKYIGITTNNIAEYEAVIHALKWLIDNKIGSATIKLDSELVYRQLAGDYKIRAQHIKYQTKRIAALKQELDHLLFVLIPRDENNQANRLAQRASKKQRQKRKKFVQETLLKDKTA